MSISIIPCTISASLEGSPRDIAENRISTVKMLDSKNSQTQSATQPAKKLMKRKLDETEEDDSYKRFTKRARTEGQDSHSRTPVIEAPYNLLTSRKDEISMPSNDSVESHMDESKTANRALALAELKKRRKERDQRVESLSRSTSSGSLSPPAKRPSLEEGKRDRDAIQGSESTLTRYHHANARHASVMGIFCRIPVPVTTPIKRSMTPLVRPKKWPEFTGKQRNGVIDAVGRGRPEEIINHLPEIQKPIITNRTTRVRQYRQSRMVPFRVQKQWECRLRVRYIPLVGFEHVSESPCGEVCEGNDIYRHLEGHFGTARLDSLDQTCTPLRRCSNVSSNSSFVWSARPTKSYVKRVRVP